MSDNKHRDNESHTGGSLSTGELAAQCGVTVRTVQYYDKKGLLPPSGLTEGGRRVYTDADAERLRRIVLLKSLGLRLADIQSFLSSDVSTSVLRDILEEQDRVLAAELEERVAARKRIAAMIESLDETGELPATIIPDMEEPVEKLTWKTSELRPFYLQMLAVGIVIDTAEIAAIWWWVSSGDWRPFAIVMAVVLVAVVLVLRVYRARVAYVCPQCRSVFVPTATEWFFARHTPTTRKVTCTHCGEKHWCAEVSRDRMTS